MISVHGAGQVELFRLVLLLSLKTDVLLWVRGSVHMYLDGFVLVDMIDAMGCLIHWIWPKFTSRTWWTA